MKHVQKAMEPPMTASDDDDWIELEKKKPTNGELPLVGIRMAFWGKSASQARTSMVFRREAVEFMREHGPRFTVSVGGKDLDKIRIVADIDRGKFECVEFKGAFRLQIGIVNVFPNEQRDPEACTFKIDDNTMFVQLPFLYGRSRSDAGKKSPAPIAPTIAPRPRVDTSGIKLTTEAKGTAAIARTIDRRPETHSHSFGDPPSGRSALDQRNGK
jgi:hypothetical protein